MIIVEGCDNAGKTTLVHTLSDEFKLLTILNRRRPRTLQQSWDYLTRIMPAASLLPTVMDRFMAVSEPVYGPICRNEKLYSPADQRGQFNFVQECLGVKPLLIYCRPPKSAILNFGDRPQMNGVIENAELLVDAYDDMVEWIREELPVQVIHYNWTSQNALPLLKALVTTHLQGAYKHA